MSKRNKTISKVFIAMLTFLLLAIPAKAQSTHSADQNADGTISLSELLRGIQFFNVGSLQCDAAGDDGFNPGNGDQSCTPHDSDYNLQDWIISFDELLRMIQLFNSLGYYPCPSVGEDGFCPDIIITLPGGVPLELAQIPTGTFQMGSYFGEQGAFLDQLPKHTVNITYTFQLGMYEVTRAQWFAVMGDFPENKYGDPDMLVPARNVSWYDIQTFLTILNGMGLGTFRLPSEAEWEYSCRAGTTTHWSHGDVEAGLENYAWYNDSYDGYYLVGQKLPNPFGLYDMHGGLWEWCQDVYHEDYTGAPSDGSAWEGSEGYYAVLRGGSSSSAAQFVRSAFRHKSSPDRRASYRGFRLVREN